MNYIFSCVYQVATVAANRRQKSWTTKWRNSPLLSKAVLKPLIVVNIFNVVQILSGTYTIIFYAVSVLEQAEGGADTDKEVELGAAVLTALVRTIVTACACCLLLKVKNSTNIFAKFSYNFIQTGWSSTFGNHLRSRLCRCRRGSGLLAVHGANPWHPCLVACYPGAHLRCVQHLRLFCAAWIDAGRNAAGESARSSRRSHVCRDQHDAVRHHQVLPGGGALVAAAWSLLFLRRRHAGWHPVCVLVCARDQGQDSFWDWRLFRWGQFAVAHQRQSTPVTKCII